jgi:hypothetical protein
MSWRSGSWMSSGCATSSESVHGSSGQDGGEAEGGAGAARGGESTAGRAQGGTTGRPLLAPGQVAHPLTEDSAKEVWHEKEQLPKVGAGDD